MAENSKIEWTDHTFNPWIGCTKIAPACDHCYAAHLMDERLHRVEWGGERKLTSEANWKKPLQWQRNAADFFAKHGRRQKVFCASLADVFDNQVLDAWRDDLWELIGRCPDLDWLLLTKRPQNIVKMLPDRAAWSLVKGHVWLGTTVEDQKHADQNIPYLLQHDSAVRFLSCEPLLGPIDLTSVAPLNGYATNALAGFIHDFGVPDRDTKHKIDWVIAGGESGAEARPSHPEWMRSLRDQCAAENTPFLFKQWGEWDADALLYTEVGTGLCPPPRMKIGKRRSGRRLDGITHDGFPTAMQVV